MCPPAVWGLVSMVSGLKPASAMMTVNQLTPQRLQLNQAHSSPSTNHIVYFRPIRSGFLVWCHVWRKEAINMNWFSIVECHEWHGDDAMHKQWHLIKVSCWHFHDSSFDSSRHQGLNKSIVHGWISVAFRLYFIKW